MVGVLTANEIEIHYTKYRSEAHRRFTKDLSDPCNQDAFVETHYINVCRKMALHLEKNCENLNDIYDETGMAGVEPARILIMRFLRALPENIIPGAVLGVGGQLWKKSPREIHKMVTRCYRPQCLTVVERSLVPQHWTLFYYVTSFLTRLVDGENLCKDPIRAQSVG
jgi:hypothetical protein